MWNFIGWVKVKCWWVVISLVEFIWVIVRIVINVGNRIRVG